MMRSASTGRGKRRRMISPVISAATFTPILCTRHSNGIGPRPASTRSSRPCAKCPVKKSTRSGMRTGMDEDARAGQVSRRELGARAGEIGGSGNPDLRVRLRRETSKQRIDDLAFYQRAGADRVGFGVDALHNEKHPRIETH